MKSLFIAITASALIACTQTGDTPSEAQPGPPPSSPENTRNGGSETSATATAPARGRKAACKVGPPRTPSGTKRFWTKDKRCFRSPWFAKAHRVMIYFGCTRAPYYAPAPRCPGRQGIHHGVDIDMPVGTKIFSNVRGRIVKGTLGSAYGKRAFIVRNRRYDFVIGHVRKALRRDGARVRRGQRIAVSGKRGAPDGPHLHFEVRPRGGEYTDALRPKRFFKLRVKRR